MSRHLYLRSRKEQMQRCNKRLRILSKVPSSFSKQINFDLQIFTYLFLFLSFFSGYTNVQPNSSGATPYPVSGMTPAYPPYPTSQNTESKWPYPPFPAYTNQNSNFGYPNFTPTYSPSPIGGVPAYPPQPSPRDSSRYPSPTSNISSPASSAVSFNFSCAVDCIRSITRKSILIGFRYFRVIAAQLLMNTFEHR